MYSKIYSITVPADNADALMAHYDDQVASAVRESDHHTGHQMVEVAPGSYLLVSNYKSKQDAEDAMTMVQKLIAPMVERFGMKIEIIGAGETIKEVS